MPDDKDGQQPTRDANAEPFPPSPPEPTIEQRIVALEANNRANDNKNEPSDLATVVKTGEAWLIGINAFALLASIGIGIIYIFQLCEMRKATKASQQAAYEACRGSQISRAALLQSINSGIDAHDSAVAATYQTMVSTQSEAADIIPSIESANLTIGQPVTALFHVKNLGKSTAKKVRTRIQIMLVPRNDDPVATYPVGRSASSETPTLFADTEVSQINGHSVGEKLANGENRIFTESDFRSMSASREDLLSFVRITYIDVLGVSHWVNYCRVFPPANSVPGKLPVHGRCVRYNQTDNNTILRGTNKTFLPVTVPEITCTKPE